MNEQCAGHLGTLLRLIERGEEVPADLRSHVAACAECARLLDAMNRMHAELEREDRTIDEPPVVTKTVQLSAAAVFRSRRARIAMRATAAAVTLAVAAWMLAYGIGSPIEGLAVAGIAFLVIAPLFIAVAILFFLRERFRAPGHAIYKRQRPGRQLDGVCLGLSEALRVPVIVPRMTFVLVFLVGGAAGIWLYLLLALLIPLHPDDRQYLRRFAIARAWRRMTGRG